MIEKNEENLRAGMEKWHENENKEKFGYKSIRGFWQRARDCIIFFQGYDTFYSIKIYS